METTQAADPVVAPKGILAYYFLRDYRNYSGQDGERPGDIAGLKIDVGDKLAATVISETNHDKLTTKSAICRRANAGDFVRKKEYAARGKRRQRPILVAVEFEQATNVGTQSYRGPTHDKKADVAGFLPGVAKKLCEGWLTGAGTKVFAVAHYHVAVVDEALEAPAEDADRPKPAAGRRRDRSKKASPDPKGAPEQKGE